jgi:hypothetical protein
MALNTQQDANESPQQTPTLANLDQIFKFSSSNISFLHACYTVGDL